MKARKIIGQFICFLAYVIGFCAGLAIPGIAGGLEFNDITTGQFWLYEFFAFASIFGAILVYEIGDAIRPHLRKK
jgi:hypothetical protein